MNLSARDKGWIGTILGLYVFAMTGFALLMSSPSFKCWGALC